MISNTISHPLVSIIVPVYKVEKYLAKCLDTICAQTYKHIEIIAVNDASPDGCAQILADYAARDERVRVITHAKNKGNSEARNTGLDASMGEYILFVDSDDYVDTQLVEKAVARAVKYDTDIVMWGIWTFYEDKKNRDHEYNCVWRDIKAEEPFSVHTHSQLYHDIFLYPFHSAFNKLFKKEFLIAHDIRFIKNPIYFYEDVLFGNVSLLRATSICWIDESLSFYRKRGNPKDQSITDCADKFVNLRTAIMFGKELQKRKLYEHVFPNFIYFCYHHLGLLNSIYECSKDSNEFYVGLRTWTQEIYPPPPIKKRLCKSGHISHRYRKIRRSRSIYLRNHRGLFTCATNALSKRGCGIFIMYNKKSHQ